MSQENSQSNLPDSPFLENDNDVKYQSDTNEACVCTYKGNTYIQGQYICISGGKWQCTCSGWVNTGQPC
jgi:hypothetical protein